MADEHIPLLDRFRLDGCRALVTGAGKGIGRGIATGLAEAGADVVVTARTASDLDEVVSEIEAAGRRAHGIAGDITDGDFVESLADQALEALGGLDLWVSNAGGADDRTPRRLDEMPDRQWDYQMDLNLRAVFTGARAAARVMESGSSIINISSGAAVKPVATNGPYGVAKAGVNSLTRTMSVELAPRGIRVNAVSPGPVPTDIFMEFFGAKEEDLPKMAKEWGVPLGRLGSPEDIANAVVFLASPAASWITSQILTVNGGDR